jgi:hypothetical protein
VKLARSVGTIAATEILASGNDMAAIPGTSSTWMVGGWCSASCRTSVQVMINGKLPG